MRFPMGPHMRQLRFIAHTPPRRALCARLLAGMLLATMPIVFTSGANAQALRYAPTQDAFPQDYVTGAPEPEEDSVLPERLRRAVVSFNSSEAPGTIIIDTGNTTLYYVLGQGRAIRYGVGVGREGFTWSGVQTITRKMVWPDWHPPAEMIARQPYLPRFMAGGRGNPLGARAMYLGSSEFRIHGTNDPTTIGKFVSSGCIRLTNDDVIDLANRIDVGTKVVVMPKTARLQARGMPTMIRPAAMRSRALALPRAAGGRQAMNSETVAVY
jgi:lipoprotein-anchoring transpeptidase ErfK/SrfK